MYIPFKLESGAVEASANVGQSNFKAFYPEINRSMAFLELKPYIEQAVDTYVIPYISQEQYDSVLTLYHNGTVLSTEQARFLELLQRAAAYYTVMHALPKKLGVLASMGAVQNAPNGGSTGISQWNYHNQLLSITKDADRFLDALLSYLEGHLSVFTGWAGSAAYTKGKSVYFRTVSEYQEYHGIGDSFRTFVALVPYMKKATEKYILPIIGNGLHTELNTALLAQNTTEEQDALIHQIRRCLAEWTMYMGIPSLMVVVEHDGIKVISNTDGMATRGNTTSAFLKEAAQIHQYQCEENARTFRADLIDFLNTNQADYPTWKTSEFYLSTAATEGGAEPPIGDRGGVFA